MLLCVYLACIAKLELLAITLTCALIHEASHALAAKFFGYRLNVINLMPYGAVITGEENLQSNDAFFIAVAGPLVNLLLAVITMALWWAFPAVYPYTITFFRVNISLALFNLLPFYPLDGGRIILSFSKNKLIALKRLRLAGIVGSVIFIALFVVSAFFKINYSLGITSIMLFFGATSGAEKQKYVEICSFLSDFKDYRRPVERREIIVNSNITLHRLIMSLSSKKLYTVQVVDNFMNTLCILENGELDRLLSYPDKKERIANIIPFIN